MTKPRLGRWVATLAITVVLGLAGCANAHSGGGGSSAPSAISGNWVLASAADAQAQLNLTGSTVTLRIDGEKSGGQGPCNLYGSPMTGSATGPRAAVYTGPIEIAHVRATQRACLADSLNVLEGRYFAVLGKITSASLIDHSLVLRGPNVELRFDKAK